MVSQEIRKTGNSMPEPSDDSDNIGVYGCRGDHFRTCRLSGIVNERH